MPNRMTDERREFLRVHFEVQDHSRPNEISLELWRELAESQARVQELETKDHYNTGMAEQYIAQLAKSQACIVELEAVVEKLPKTADGVAVSPGEFIYNADGKEFVVVINHIEPTPDTDYSLTGWWGPMTYSTREAALAACAAKGDLT